MEVVNLYDRQLKLVDRLRLPAGRRPGVIVWQERIYVHDPSGNITYTEAEVYDADLAEQIPF